MYETTVETRIAVRRHRGDDDGGDVQGSIALHYRGDDDGGDVQ